MALSVCDILKSRKGGHDWTPVILSEILQSRCCSSRLAPNPKLDAESHFGLKFTLNPRRRSSVASANASIKSSGPSQESADTSWLRPARRICPSFGGPRVRIHFPPAVSQLPDRGAAADHKSVQRALPQSPSSGHREALPERLYACYRGIVAQTHQISSRELRRQLLPWENLPVQQRDFWEAMAARVIQRSMFG